MVSDTPEKVPWDQRLAERLAQEAWDAANNPDRRPQNPPFREQIKSPSYWLSLLLTLGTIVLINHATRGWMYALAAILYLGGLVVMGRSRRSRAARLPRMSTKEKP